MLFTGLWGLPLGLHHLVGESPGVRFSQLHFDLQEKVLGWIKWPIFLGKVLPSTAVLTIKPTSFHWFHRKEDRAVIKKLVGFKPRSMGNPLWCFTTCNLSQLNQNLLFFYRGAHLQVMSENIFCFFQKSPKSSFCYKILDWIFPPQRSNTPGMGTEAIL